MKRHRTRILAATAALATVSALVLVAALIVVPALATPQTGLTAEQVALGHFGKINVRTQNFPRTRSSSRPRGTLTSSHPEHLRPGRFLRLAYASRSQPDHGDQGRDHRL